MRPERWIYTMLRLRSLFGRREVDPELLARAKARRIRNACRLGCCAQTAHPAIVDASNRRPCNSVFVRVDYAAIRMWKRFPWGQVRCSDRCG